MARYLVARPVVNMQLVGGPSWYYVDAKDEAEAEVMAAYYEDARDWPVQPEKADPSVEIVGVDVIEKSDLEGVPCRAECPPEFECDICA